LAAQGEVMKKHSEEFKKFDAVMSGLLAVPYSGITKGTREGAQEKSPQEKAG
jgi:hypothetical protein